MAGRHPLDSAGRMLPDAGWPVERQAPGALELVRRFCNSTNRENGAERFDSPASLDRWLVTEGLEAVAASRPQLARLIEVREALLPLLVANANANANSNFTEADAGRAWSTLHRLVAETRFESAVGDSGSGLRVVPIGTPFEQLLGRLVLTISEAAHDGTWRRLKACQHCQWVVFDPSKNRSSRWCSMSVCGGRHNARQYRRRVSRR